MVPMALDAVYSVQSSDFFIFSVEEMIGWFAYYLLNQGFRIFVKALSLICANTSHKQRKMPLEGLFRLCLSSVLDVAA